MSDNDNLNETTASTEENAAAAPEAVETATAEAPAANAQAEAAQQMAGNLVSKLLELKESNPKVFFGGIGGLVVVLLALTMSGGDSKKLPSRQNKDITVGQNYVLSSPNAYDPAATVRLVTVPGSMAAYDDTEEADRNGPCKHMPQNTRVKAKQIQGGGNQGTFVQVEMLDGECAGKDGWTLAINLQ